MRNPWGKRNVGLREACGSPRGSTIQAPHDAWEIQGQSVGVGGQASGSTVTTMAIHDVLLARLTIPNHVYPTDFLGTKVNALRTPAVEVAEQIEQFIKTNADGLRTANPQRP